MGYDYYDVSSYARSLDTATAVGLGALGAMFVVYMIIALAIAILQIVAMWRIFTKAGEKGWKAIIPIYNAVILYKISGVSPWLLFIYLASFIPFVGWIAVLVLNIYQANNLSKSFGKDVGYTVGLILLAPIFYMILGFGSADYVGPGGKAKVIETETVESDEDKTGE